MLPFPEISEKLKTLEGEPWQGILTRYVDFEAYMGPSGGRLLYDEGPPRRGQRYTPIKGAKGLYLAEGIPTAVAEYTQEGLKALNPKRAATRLHLDAEVKLTSILNLGDAAIRRALKTSIEELKEPWQFVFEMTGIWPVTWQLGDAVFSSGRFDGIRFPSSKADRHYCHLVFSERLGPDSFVRAKGPTGKWESLTGKSRLKA